MASKSKTITIHLPNGNPNGLKIVELSNRPFQVLIIPNLSLKEVADENLLKFPAIYFLTDFTDSQVYIGQSEGVYSRLYNHVAKKEFWDLAFVVVCESWERGDIAYLEHLFIKQAKEAKRSTVHNDTVPQKNNLHRSKVSVVEEQFEEISLIISTMGYAFLDKVEEVENLMDKEIWYLKRKNIDAKGIVTDKGFTLLKGSVINSENTPSLEKYFSYAAARRKDLIQELTQAHSVESRILMVDITFKSLNSASEFCLGRSPNAWKEWKNEQGELIDKLR